MVLDDRGQYAEEEEEEEGDGGSEANGSGVLFDSTMIENIQNQVTLL